MESDALLQRFMKITGGSLNPLGFEALSDYGRVFLPWMNISHLALVIFERAGKGYRSIYLVMLLKNTPRIYYIDGIAANYTELLGPEAEGNLEASLKMLINAILRQFFDTYIDPGIFAFLKGLGHMLRRCSNLRQFGEFCEEVRVKSPAENMKLDESIISNFRVTERQKLLQTRREAVTFLTALGFHVLSGEGSLEGSVPSFVERFIDSSRTPEEYFTMASQIDPYYHMAAAGLGLCALSHDNTEQALAWLEHAVNTIPYPGGIAPEHVKFYADVLDGYRHICLEDREILRWVEKFLGFSARREFHGIIAPLYEKLGISPEWYSSYLAAMSLVAKKKYVESLEPIGQVMAGYPDFVWALHWQGVSLARMGRPGEAQRAYAQVMEKLKILQPMTCSHTWIEMFLLKKNREDGTFVDRAFEANPFSAWACYFMGNHSLVYEKNVTKGACYFLRALCVDFSEPVVSKIRQDMASVSVKPEAAEKEARRKELQRGDYLGGKYQITQVFRGGMGIVYIVYEASSSTLFAVKTFQEQYLWDKSIIEMFIHEAEIWIKLESHPHIVHARFIKIFDEKPYLFLECIRGSDLDKLLSEGTLPVNRALDLAIQFCRGMSYAYNKLGVVHRDIKPSNCLITIDGILKITDFGLVRIFTDRAEKEFHGTAESLPQDVQVTATKSFMGTIAYMGPERLLMMEQGDIRSDIYSFGVMFYLMLTGKHPFDTERLLQDFSLIITETPQLPHEVNRKVSPELSQIVMQCLAEDPAERYGNFEELEALLVPLYEKLAGKRFEGLGTARAISRDELITEGNSLVSIGHYGEALKCFELVLKEDSGSLPALVGRSNALLKRGDYQEALAGFDAVLSRDPENAEVLRNKASALMEMNRNQEAVKCLERILLYYPADAEAWWKRGVIARKSGKYEEALRFFEKSLAQDPRFFAVLNDKATLLVEMKRVPEGVECFNKALEINPAALEILINRGYALLEMLQVGRASADFRQVLTVEKENRQALHGMALSLAKAGDFKKSLEHYDAILKLDPADGEALVKKAGVLRELGLREESLDIYERLHQDGLSSDPLLLEEALILKSLFYYERSRGILAEIVERDPENRRAPSIIGEIDEELKNFESITTIYEEFCGLDEESIMATVEGLNGEARYREAGELVNRGLGFNPASLKLLAAMANLLAKQQRYTEALIAFDRALEEQPEDTMIAGEREQVVRTLTESRKGVSRGLIKKLFSGGDAGGDPLAAYERYKRGRAYDSAGDRENAVRCYDESLSIEKENARAFYYRGLILRSGGLYEEALACFDRALEIDDSIAEIWCARGEVEQVLGRDAEFHLCCERSLTLNPFHFPAWINLIAFYREMGHARKSRLYAMYALQMVEHQRAVNPPGDSHYSRKALFEYILGRYRSSLQTCALMLEKDEKSYAGLYIKALVSRCRCQYWEALDCLKKAGENFPTDIPVLLQMGHICEIMDDCERAMNNLDTILSLFPQQEWALYQASLLFFRRGIQDEGLKCLDYILGFKANSALILKSKALSLYWQGKKDDALWCYKEIVGHNPEDFIAQQNFVVLSNALEHSADAVRSTDYLLTIESFNPIVWILRGDSLMLTGAMDDAAKCYNRALEIDSSCVEAYIHYAQLQHKRGNQEESLQILKAGLVIYPYNKFLLNNYALMLFHLNRRGESLEFLEKALEIDSADENILCNKAILFVMQNNLAEASRILNSALLINAGFVDGLIARGLLGEFMKIPRDALNFYDQALAHDPKNARLNLCRGKALYSLNKYDEALRSFNQVLKHSESDPSLWLYKGIVLARLGRHQEAEQCFGRYHQLSGSHDAGVDPQAMADLPEYEMEKILPMKVLGSDLAIIEDPPRDIFRAADFYFNASDALFHEWA